MTTTRPSVCYAAPGHTLVSASGSARNILAAAEALSEWANVTVVFRKIVEPSSSKHFKVVAIDQSVDAPGAKDDVAARGLNPFSHLAYLLRLRRFATQSAGNFDLVFEKGWRLSGFLARAFVARGVHAALVENDTRRWNESIRTPRSVAKYLAHRVAQAVAGYCSRRIPMVIAETEELKAALVRERGVRPGRIEVVGLGVDHERFRPGDRAAARRSLSMNPNCLVLLYVGGMDLYHDLSPLLEALCVTSAADLELHLVGDGEYRDRYDALAEGSRVPVVFHGQVEHERVPEFITAADVCLAPYRTEAFPDGDVYFSTLKIPEYMACERPVISVPSGQINRLIEDGTTGFLISNDKDSWQAFLDNPPSAELLARLGRAAAAAVAGMSWANTAYRYLSVNGFFSRPRGEEDV